MKSTRFNVLSEDIPFSTLVFQGYKPLTSSSINLAVNVEKTYLQAISTGMAPQFTLCDTLHESIQFDQDTAFVSSCYEDWSGRIADMVNRSADVLAKVGNQPIKNYTVDGDLTITEFENGMKIYANCYKCGDETVHPHFIAWNKIENDIVDFHQPEHFGLMVLE